MNHIIGYCGCSARRTYVQATPLGNGTFVPVYFKQEFACREQLKDFDPNNPGGVLFYCKQLVTSRALRADDDP